MTMYVICPESMSDAEILEDIFENWLADRDGNLKSKIKGLFATRNDALGCWNIETEDEPSYREMGYIVKDVFVPRGTS